jgi:phospholipase/carboxylesterase
MNQDLDLGLVYRIRQPQTNVIHPLTLVLLHGFGSNEDGLFGLAPYLDSRLRVVSVRAPHTLMPGGYAWFELNWTEAGVSFDRQQALQSRTLVEQFLEQLAAAYQIEPQHLILGGFSQGGMMTASVLLQRPELLSAALIMSGTVPPDLVPETVASEALQGKPVLMQHGRYDQVLDVQRARAGHTLLSQYPLDLVYQEYPMEHEINAASLTDLNTWMSKRLIAHAERTTT